MIRDDTELLAARESLDQLFSEYLAYRAEMLPASPKTFALVAPSFTSEIARLTESVSAYLHIPVVAVSDAPDITIRLKGLGVDLGRFSAAAIGSCLAHFQTGISRIADARQGRQQQSSKEAKKVAKEVRNACQFSLAGVGPGSVVLYLSSSDRSAMVSESAARAPEAAIAELVERIRESKAFPENLSDEYLSDADQNMTRYHAFKTVYELMPTDQSVESVEVSFARKADENEPQTISINRAIANRAKKWTKQIASAGIRITEVGRLRGANLDRRTFVLADREGSRKHLAGRFPVELADEVRARFDERVRITGILKTVGRRQSMDMEAIVLEDAGIRD